MKVEEAFLLTEGCNSIKELYDTMITHCPKPEVVRFMYERFIPKIFELVKLLKDACKMSLKDIAYCLRKGMQLTPEEIQVILHHSEGLGVSSETTIEIVTELFDENFEIVV